MWIGEKHQVSVIIPFLGEVWLYKQKGEKGSKSKWKQVLIEDEVKGMKRSEEIVSYRFSRMSRQCTRNNQLTSYQCHSKQLQPLPYSSVEVLSLSWMGDYCRVLALLCSVPCEDFQQKGGKDVVVSTFSCSYQLSSIIFWCNRSRKCDWLITVCR